MRTFENLMQEMEAKKELPAGAVLFCFCCKKQRRFI